MIHVAILMKPYINLIGHGEKTVECRLTKFAKPPFQSISEGDRIYFKESAGPYHLTAIADHVLFEGDLTPARVREIRDDYNDLIRGDEQFWQWKRDSRFLTLIWLRDVEPVETGPGIAPQRGIAWITLPDGSGSAFTNGGESDSGRGPRSQNAARKTAPALSFSIPITEGNLRNNSLYVTRVIDCFPEWAIGGPNAKEAAEPVTLILRDGPTVRTDIVGPRKLFRKRCWGRWYRKVGAEAGDAVVFTPIDEATYFVGLLKSSAASRPVSGPSAPADR